MFLTDSNLFKDFFRTFSNIWGGAFCEKRCFHFTTLYLSLHYKFSTKPTNFFQVKMQQWWKQVFLKLLIDSWISAFSSNIENVRSVLRPFKSTSLKIHCALCFFAHVHFFNFYILFDFFQYFFIRSTKYAI